MPVEGIPLGVTVRRAKTTSESPTIPLFSINNSPPTTPDELPTTTVSASQPQPLSSLHHHQYQRQTQSPPHLSPSPPLPGSKPAPARPRTAPTIPTPSSAATPVVSTTASPARHGSVRSIDSPRLSSESKSLSPRLGSNRRGRMRQDPAVAAAYEMAPMQKAGAMVFTTTPTKEDLAMAKWRKWAVDQPVASPVDTSPIRSRKPSATSPSPLSSPPPAAPIPSSASYASSHTSPIVLGSPLASRPGAPNRLPSEASTSTSASSSHASASAPAAPSSRSGSGGPGPRGFDTTDIFMTDSVRALQDVELAVDEDMVARTAQTRQPSRLLSIAPRVSDAENPFAEIAGRLGSRRIRPIVLELIQALGHYIHTLWCLAHPTEKCPWVIPPSEASIATPLLRGWRSRTITAVHDAQIEGLLPPSSQAQLSFWRAEVEYGLRDVDDAVGRWKKQGRIFHEAIKRGYYGEVEDDNVLGSMGHSGPGRKNGGDIARLLNDLEEAIWGDALPRSTDLSYLLPADFDPFAPPGADEFFSPAPSSTLADILGSPVQILSSQPTSALPSPTDILDDIYAMPDLVTETPLHERPEPGSEPTTPRAALTNMGISQAWTEHARKSISAQGGGDPLHDPPGEPVLSLEEVGRKRHEEWLAGQKVG